MICYGSGMTGAQAVKIFLCYGIPWNSEESSCFRNLMWWNKSSLSFQLWNLMEFLYGTVKVCSGSRMNRKEEIKVSPIPWNSVEFYGIVKSLFCLVHFHSLLVSM